VDDIIDLYEHIDYERSYYYTKNRIMTDPFYIRKKAGAYIKEKEVWTLIPKISQTRSFRYIKGDLEIDISNIEILNKLKVDNIYYIRRYQKHWTTGYYFYNLFKVKVLFIDSNTIVLDYIRHDTDEHNIDCNFTPEQKLREIKLKKLLEI
jgi:hypothetical protein